MKKFYAGAFFLGAILSTSAQEFIWQRDIKSSTQNFLSQVTTTIDGQYLISGSSIRPSRASGITSSTHSGGTLTGHQPAANSQQQNNGYDFHLVKLNQQGEPVWEKFFAGKNHDFLSAAVATQSGDFLLAGTSYSGKGLDKKEDSKGGSDIWLIRLDESGGEL